MRCNFTSQRRLDDVKQFFSQVGIYSACILAEDGDVSDEQQDERDDEYLDQVESQHEKKLVPKMSQKWKKFKNIYISQPEENFRSRQIPKPKRA